MIKHHGLIFEEIIEQLTGVIGQTIGIDVKAKKNVL